MRVIDEPEVDSGDWEVNLTGCEIKVYVGLYMAKDKFYWCVMDVTETFSSEE